METLNSILLSLIKKRALPVNQIKKKTEGGPSARDPSKLGLEQVRDRKQPRRIKPS